MVFYHFRLWPFCGLISFNNSVWSWFSIHKHKIVQIYLQISPIVVRPQFRQVHTSLSKVSLLIFLFINFYYKDLWTWILIIFGDFHWHIFRRKFCLIFIRNLLTLHTVQLHLFVSFLVIDLKDDYNSKILFFRPPPSDF